ncbi:hypothetical protein AVEN_161998-1 [Araneus ventricosus]|uniref:Uncharacterized protein n=1 Tax=Araneus ventricosus TaxID=182803 RepID=A0A4Y2K7X1_ARAVE|nr:hypothetical protein AVEN_161998-1 [Araneus ventricosus]
MTGENVWEQYLLNDPLVFLPLAEVEIKCELGHIKTKAAVVTNDPGRYVLAKRSIEEDRNKEAEMEQPEEMMRIEIDEDFLPQADEEY